MSAITNRLLSLPKLGALWAIIKVLPAPRPLVMLGEGSAQRLCRSMADQGITRVLVITDEVLAKLGTVDPLIAELHRHGVATELFTGVRPDPTFEIVEAGLAACKAARANAILVVGGGSAIDAGKVIALAASTGKTPKQLVGVLKGRQPSLPFFVVTSTSGTGSEASVAAVISDSVTHVKALIVDPALVPQAAALDPLITQGMPASVTAETGIDALTHALEGWVSGFANVETDNYNRTAIRMIFKHIETACREPKNLASREAMALASHYAGICLNVTAVGYVHAIAHQLGANYGVPHGRANAMVLPHVLVFNKVSCSKKFASLARDLGFASAQDGDTVAADALLTAVGELMSRLPLKHQGDLIKAGDYQRIADAALTEAHGMYNVPRYMVKADVYRVLDGIVAVA
jgi:alcohol dehydrogenase